MSTTSEVNYRELAIARIKTETILNPIPCVVYNTSDGRQFREPYYEQAIEWQIRIWRKERLMEAYQQKVVPDWMFFMVHPQNLNPHNLEKIRFEKAYIITVPEGVDESQAAQEILFLHPQLLWTGSRNNIIDNHAARLISDLLNWKSNKYVIVYWKEDERKVADPHMADSSAILPVNEIVNRLKLMLNEFESFL